MKFKFVLSALIGCLALYSPANMIRNASELAKVAYADAVEWRKFELEGKVAFAPYTGCYTLALEDASGTVVLRECSFWPKCPLRAGDVIRASGITCRTKGHPVFAETRSVTVLAHGEPPKPILASFSEFQNSLHDGQLTRIKGIVRNAFRDEIDPKWTYVVLRCGMETAYLTFVSSTNADASLNALVGTTISATGIPMSVHSGLRRHIGRTMLTTGLESFSILSGNPARKFSVPDITSISERRPEGLSKLGMHRAIGRAIAVWQGNCILIRQDSGRLVRVELIDSHPPKYGDLIEVAGFPETDLYRINLTQCIWRRIAPASPMETSSTIRICTDDIFTKESDGHMKYNADCHGREICIAGTVKDLPSAVNNDGLLHLKSGSHIISIDASSAPESLSGVDVDCEIEVSGTCVMETDNWNVGAAFPHVKGFRLVVRTPSDIKVIKYPPWWTTGRLMAVIGTLIIALVAILVWNASLRVVAERRGRELLREQIERVKADLKIEERTRLAVELHDSLAQSLTGVSMEIEAAESLKGNAPADMLSHLSFAARTLMSCRNELRNCLWDLRSQALEEKNMDKAIERTMLPYVNDSRIAVSFNLPRTRLSDNTAHTLLRIIRELVINAIHHGKASSIQIGGGIHDGEIRLYVQDDGCGFDPKSCPGVLQGHFGIQGITERVEQLGGQFNIESTIGKGTRASITLKLPSPTACGSANT